MKKILVALALLAVVGSADAHGYYRGGRCCWGGGWIAPLAVGGLIGYELSRPHYYEPPPVIIQQPPVYIQQPQIVQEPPAGYHWQMMVDPATNQQRPVLVPN
jgi:hypothetical protein